jgi:hypothetical protein
MLGVTLARRPIDPGPRSFPEDYAMTIDILIFTQNIQRWLNALVAQHLENQATKLAR